MLPFQTCLHILILPSFAFTHQSHSITLLWLLISFSCQEPSPSLPKPPLLPPSLPGQLWHLTARQHRSALTAYRQGLQVGAALRAVQADLCTHRSFRQLKSVTGEAGGARQPSALLEEEGLQWSPAGSSVSYVKQWTEIRLVYGEHCKVRDSLGQITPSPPYNSMTASLRWCFSN